MGAKRSSVAIQIRWWTIVAGCSIVLLTSASEAAAACQNGSTTQTISAGTAGSTVISIMAASHPPCTLSLAPGTYTAPVATSFTIQDGITVRASGAAGSAVLQIPFQSPPQFSVVSIWPIGGSCPSGATLEGLTLNGGAWGIFVGADPVVHVGCPSNQVSGITLRNLTINPVVTTDGHGIDFHAV